MKQYQNRLQIQYFARMVFISKLTIWINFDLSVIALSKITEYVIIINFLKSKMFKIACFRKEMRFQ